VIAATPVRTHRIAVPALDRAIECRDDETLYAAARRAGLRIVGACGGRGNCGSCIVRVVEGRVHRELEGAHRKWLRACCIQPRSDLAIEVAPRSLAQVVRADVRTGGEDIALPLDPSIEAVELSLKPATLQDLANDGDRLLRELARQAMQPAAIDWAASAALPGLLRDNDWRVQARLRRCGPDGTETICNVARPGARCWLAVTGHTNAAFLVDLAADSGSPAWA
jgi:ferredoxin